MKRKIGRRGDLGRKKKIHCGCNREFREVESGVEVKRGFGTSEINLASSGIFY